jgi:aspartyl/asparaginyl beta-hydroxylase (cupin superfamily)
MFAMFEQRPRPWTTYDTRGHPAHEPHVYDPAAFDWVPEVEAQWTTIRDELRSAIGEQDGVLQSYPDPNMTNRKGAWKTAGLMYWTFPSDRYIAMFPKTWAILKKIPHLTSASLLLLEPNSTIKPHLGDANAMIRCHMGLIVPAPAPRCGLRVKGTTFSWEEGRILMFNDAHEHTAWNNTDQNRYILSFDVMRPEFVGMEKWVSSRVLGNIYVDVMLMRHAWLRRLFGNKWGEAVLRRLAYAMFRTLMFLKLPLYDLL